MVELFANSGDPDQTLCSAASDLGLHCLPFTHLRVSSLQWVNMIASVIQFESDVQNICVSFVTFKGSFFSEFIQKL